MGSFNGGALSAVAFREIALVIFGLLTGWHLLRVMQIRVELGPFSHSHSSVSSTSYCKAS